MSRFLLSCVAFALLLLPAGAQFPVPGAQFSFDFGNYDATTGRGEARGNVRFTHQGMLVEANQASYENETRTISLRGEVRLSYQGRLVLADTATYRFTDQMFSLENVRIGDGFVYVRARSGSGTPNSVQLREVSFTFSEPSRFTPTVTADSLIYDADGRIRAEGGRLGIGLTQPIPLPTFTRLAGQSFLAQLTATGGYRSSLGAYLTAGLLLPVTSDIRLGGEAGYYTRRGLLIGPAADYGRTTSQGTLEGSLHSGYIRDHGDRLTDVLGDPVPSDRGFVRWEHHQRINPRTTFTGQIHYWSDSEIIRDFRRKEFEPVQTPDSFLEATYLSDNYVLSLFSRVQPNDYHAVQQRLPELRFDLLPRPIGGGLYARAQAGAAILREDPPAGGLGLRSDRFDAYLGLSRPYAPREWLSVQPVVGGRVTHYARTADDTGDYTRVLGEVGLDAELRAHAKWDYKNERWGIDGLRHLVTPRISYRYLPEGDRGRAHIPAIDRRTFDTYLRPLGLGEYRAIDDLERLHTIRLAIDNRLQTRRAGHGSRDLAALQIAGDFRLDPEPGERNVSSIHTELRLSPAPWLDFRLYQRLNPHNGELGELNTAVTLQDGNIWALQLATHYLRGDIQEYVIDYQHRFNEVFQGIVEIHYDDRRRRFIEQTYGVRHTLHNLWAVQYEVSFFDGPRRESSFRFNIEVQLATF